MIGCDVPEPKIFWECLLVMTDRFSKEIYQARILRHIAGPNSLVLGKNVQSPSRSAKAASCQEEVCLNGF